MKDRDFPVSSYNLATDEDVPFVHPEIEDIDACLARTLPEDVDRRVRAHVRACRHCLSVVPMLADLVARREEEDPAEGAREENALAALLHRVTGHPCASPRKTALLLRAEFLFSRPTMCPPRETILSFARNGIRKGSRLHRKVSAHLIRCGRCIRIASGTEETP